MVQLIAVMGPKDLLAIHNKEPETMRSNHFIIVIASICVVLNIGYCSDLEETLSSQSEDDRQAEIYFKSIDSYYSLNWIVESQLHYGIKKLKEIESVPILFIQMDTALRDMDYDKQIALNNDILAHITWFDCLGINYLNNIVRAKIRKDSDCNVTCEFMDAIRWYDRAVAATPEKRYVAAYSLFILHGIMPLCIGKADGAIEKSEELFNNVTIYIFDYISKDISIEDKVEMLDNLRKAYRSIISVYLAADNRNKALIIYGSLKGVFDTNYNLLKNNKVREQYEIDIQSFRKVFMDKYNIDIVQSTK